MTGLQQKKGRSIQSRLIVLLLFILIPVLAIQSYTYYDSYQARRASELQANLEIARLLAKAFESFVQDVIHQELAIGVAITSSQPMASKDITRLLETNRDSVAVRDFTWLTSNGDAIYSSNPAMIGINYSDRSYFRDVTNGRDWMVSELVLAKTTGEPVFAISRGIRNSKGALLGIVAAVVIPEKLDARLAVERSKGGGYALVDKKGMLVYRYPAIKSTWEERNWLKTYPEFGEALKGKEIATTVYAPYEGKNRLVGFTPIYSVGWVASAGKREEDVTGPILSSIGKNALLFLFFSFAAFFVALAVSRKIASPVTALHAHALALGRDETHEEVSIDHVSEFRDLAEAFNKMAGEIRAREMDLRESEQRWATTLASIGDAVIATDVEGRITFMNTVAEELTGWTLSEAAMKPVTVAFNIVNERTRKEVENPITKVLREGMIVGLANHTILIKKDGTGVPIDDSGAPIRDKEGNTLGVVLVFRDITERKHAEAYNIHLQNSVQEERDRLSALVNSISDEVWFADTQKRFTLMNPSAIKEFSLGAVDGIDVEKLAGSLEVYRPDGSPRPIEETPPLRALGGEVVRDQEEIIRTPASGAMRYRQVSAAPVRDASGNIIGSVSVVRDITKRKRAEEAVRASEQWLRMFYESGLVGMFSWHIDGRITELNDRYLEMVGYTREDFMAGRLKWDQMTPPEYEPLDRRALEELKATGLDTPYEKEFIRKDGSRIPVLLGAATVNEDRTEGVAFVLDITERKKAEEDRRRSESRLNILIENVKSGVALIDDTGKFSIVNPAFLQMFGLEERETIKSVNDQNWGDWQVFESDGILLHVDEHPVRKVALTGKAVRNKMVGVRLPSGGDLIWMLISADPILRPDGSIESIICTYHDITERKQAEMALKERTLKLEEINKELESFSYSISHDLRAPLRAIDGYTRMLLKKHGHDFDEDSTRKFNVIRSSSQMMGQLIDDILTLSRLGRAKMSIVDLDMEGLITDVWKELQTINPERNMSLTIQAMPSGYGDRTLIKQVYANLLGNAVKFTKYRNPAQIEAGGYTDGDDHVYYIKDNGVGFDMAYYDKLFGIFQRLHNNPDFEGTGIGLATIQRAVHMHGGRVWAEGKVDEGATFYFSLPSSHAQ